MTAFNGPMGKLLATNVWELPVGDFQKIEVTDFPTVGDIIWKKYSTDAKTLYSLCIAVTTGMYIQYEYYIVNLGVGVMGINPKSQSP